MRMPTIVEAIDQSMRFPIFFVSIKFKGNEMTVTQNPFEPFE